MAGSISKGPGRSSSLAISRQAGMTSSPMSRRERIASSWSIAPSPSQKKIVPGRSVSSTVRILGRTVFGVPVTGVSASIELGVVHGLTGSLQLRMGAAALAHEVGARPVLGPARCRAALRKRGRAVAGGMGKTHRSQRCRSELASGKFDAVTLIHSETSTGVMNPLPEICCTLAKYPDVVLVLDTVSSFSGVPIAMDTLGIDVMLTGAQKAFALPPGFSLFSVSEKAFARAEKQKDRGYYFDFLEFKKQQAECMTPSTPSIGHIFALQSKLEKFSTKRCRSRFDRHAERMRWSTIGSVAAGFEFFAEEVFAQTRSPA